MNIAETAVRFCRKRSDIAIQNKKNILFQVNWSAYIISNVNPKRCTFLSFLLSCKYCLFHHGLSKQTKISMFSFLILFQQKSLCQKSLSLYPAYSIASYFLATQRGSSKEFAFSRNLADLTCSVQLAPPTYMSRNASFSEHMKFLFDKE